MDDMLRVAASEGLRPWEVYAMTQRELEVFIEGRQEYWARIRELLAWVMSNLMNIQRSRKTPPIKPDSLLPKKDRERRKKAGGEDKPVNLLGMTPKQASELFSQRRIEKAEAIWRASPEGQSLGAFMETLGYGEPDKDG